MVWTRKNNTTAPVTIGTHILDPKWDPKRGKLRLSWRKVVHHHRSLNRRELVPEKPLEDENNIH